MLWPVCRCLSQKACKPDRGIETGLNSTSIHATKRCQKACKPDRGIETLFSRHWKSNPISVRRPVSPIAGLKRLVPAFHQFSEFLCQKACKPDRGIETARTR